MNSKDYRNLQEAYLDVYEQEVDEAKVDFTAGRGPSANDQYPGEGSPQDKGIRSAIRKIDNARTKAGHTAKSGSRANSAEQGRRQLRVLDTVTNKDAAEKKKLQDSYDQQLDEISIGMKRRAADASVDKVQKAGERFRSSTSVDVQPYLMKKKDKAEAQHLRLAKAAESYDLYDLILSHLLDEGYKELPSKRMADAVVKKTIKSLTTLNRAKRERTSQQGLNVLNTMGSHDPTAAKAKSKYKTEQVDLYDLILSHLLDEGYADTQEAAERIMVNMSEDWRESIVETRSII